MTNNLYLMGLKVSRGTASHMPDHMSHAIAITFAAAPDVESALAKAVQEVTLEGFVFEEVEKGQAVQVPVESWADYVATSWPELADQLPSAADITGIVDKGQVFFAAFIGAPSEASQHAQN